MRFLVAITSALLCAAAATHSVAQGEPSDPVNRFVWQMFQMHEGKTLCAPNTSLPSVRAQLIDHLQVGVGAELSPETLAKALWHLYPCPFSPQRAELRQATAADVAGAWLFPEASQKLRRGPRVTGPGPAGPLPVKCDALGYFDAGELRHAVVAGAPTCPFDKALDLDAARKLPRVSSWSFMREGRLAVNRTDVASHIEEWDVYVVATAFDFREVAFREGDLVAYARREKGNEVGAATQFRHLQRLP
jgi:hypothetical protein